MKEEEETPAAEVAEVAAAEGGAAALAAMNAAFAKCLALVSPPIQYPPHCRLNPVQQDAADTLEVETRLEEFFLHAKQLELLFLGDAVAAELASLSLGAGDEAAADRAALQQQQSELELEILNLEAELGEKNDLVEKYSDVVRGWEGKFKRLEHRLAPDRE